ncbi:MAG: sigma-70 family RNA polymerase sigma factor [Lachnospiraceae bacterium]|nr:sigma-70 family RNA polymerase sigma factor [Lachnospiraceae bacterium]
MHRNMRAEEVTEIIKRNADMVYRLAFSMVKTLQDAEDIRQEVFIKYIRKNPTFESREHEKAWFIRVTTNLCKNLWKAAWHRKMVSAEGLEEDGTNWEPAGKCAAEVLSGEDFLTEEEENVVEAVKKLPIKYRSVIHLFYYEEMSVEEISRALKLQPSNVRTRLTRARSMLKEWLKEDI